MKITQSGRKHFTTEEKLQIIEECKSEGVKITCTKYGIYSGSYYYWMGKLLIDGKEGLSGTYNKQDKAKIKTLQKEVQTLKLLLAEEKLESRLIHFLTKTLFCYCLMKLIEQ